MAERGGKRGDRASDERNGEMGERGGDMGEAASGEKGGENIFLPPPFVAGAPNGGTDAC